MCKEGDELLEGGKICSLLSQHNVVIKQRGGAGGVVGVNFLFHQYSDKMEFIVHTLEQVL